MALLLVPEGWSQKASASQFIEVSIATGEDDAEEDSKNEMTRSSSDLELVYDESNQFVGLRFLGLDIPQGPTVLSAYIQFTADRESSDNEAPLILRGEAVDYPIPGSYRAILTVTDDTIASRSATAIAAVTTPESVTIAAAGDIACDPKSEPFNSGQDTADECHMKHTSDLVVAMRPSAVLVLGDTQYGGDHVEDWQASYGVTWGRFKDITYPVPGNHEYGMEGAGNYFAYFGEAAGDPS